MSFSTDIFAGNEADVTFRTHTFENTFSPKTAGDMFTVRGLVSHMSGSRSGDRPSDSARTVQLTAYFRPDQRVASLPISSTATVGDVDYSIIDVDARAVAPTPYSIAVHLTRDVI